MTYNLIKHEKRQLEILKKIEKQIESGKLKFSTVSSTQDFDKDPRTCLTSVHFPNSELISKIQQKIITPLRKISPNHYYYKNSSLHMTIKNIRVVHDPPNFEKEDIKKVKKLFSTILPKHKAFRVYFYRLFLFPTNLALVGTTDPELDKIFLNLDKGLNKIKIPDDKQYANSKYFFSNMTLVRFNSPLSSEYHNKIEEISQSLALKPYLVDSVSLITSNASLTRCNKIKTWRLKKK